MKINEKPNSESWWSWEKREEDAVVERKRVRRVAGFCGGFVDRGRFNERPPPTAIRPLSNIIHVAGPRRQQAINLLLSRNAIWHLFYVYLRCQAVGASVKCMLLPTFLWLWRSDDSPSVIPNWEWTSLTLMNVIVTYLLYCTVVWFCMLVHFRR